MMSTDVINMKVYITFIYLVYIFIRTNLEINCLLKYAGSGYGQVV